MNPIQSQEINKLPLLKSHQFIDLQFLNVRPPEQAQPSTLVFVSSVEAAQLARKKGARGFIILEKIFEQTQNLFSDACCVWTCPQINEAMFQVLPLFDPKPQAQGTIHPTALVHATAQLGSQVTIDEYAVIKENVVLADQCWVGAHSVIEASAQIGKNTSIAPHVVIGSFCEIGNECKIASHVTIGSDGFGFFTDKTNTHHKIPQIGKVVIEDQCEIGSHCAIDRATLTETRIKSGSKLDNFCHVAHNVTIGQNAMLAAGFMVAGSTHIGKNLTTAGGVQMNGHIQVVDNVILAGRTGVVSSIEQSGIYGGFPQIPHKENLKVMSSLAILPQLRKQVSKILKHLNIED